MPRCILIYVLEFQIFPHYKVLSRGVYTEMFYLGDGAKALYNLHCDLQASRYFNRDRTFQYASSEIEPCHVDTWSF